MALMQAKLDGWITRASAPPPDFLQMGTPTPDEPRGIERAAQSTSGKPYSAYGEATR
jgi:hypothetical protein